MALHPYISLERAMNESTSTGTGNMVLGSAVAGYVTLDQSPTSSSTPFPYCIEGIDGACEGQVEIGVGELVGGELVRASSKYIAAGAWVAGLQDFSSGTKRIYLRVIPPAHANLNLIGMLQSIVESNGGMTCAASAATTDATPTVMDGYWVFNRNYEQVDGATFDLDVMFPPPLLVFRLTIAAIDAVAGDYKSWALDFMVKYPSAGNAALVGTPVPVVIGATAGAAAWDVDPTASGDLVLLTVTGAATDIDWRATGTVLT